MSKYPNLEALAQGCISGLATDWIRLRPEAEDALAEIKRLRAIVDKLPRTADGVPVVDGMELFRRDRFSANDIMPASAKTDAYWVTHDGQHVVDDSKTFFSTREAAEVEAVEAAGGE